MNNLFGKPIKDMSDDELMREVDKIPWEMVHIPLGELTKRSLNKLQKTIQEFKRAIIKTNSKNDNTYSLDCRFNNCNGSRFNCADYPCFMNPFKGIAYHKF